MIRTKSVYDPPEAADGERILVMTLWPRGVSRDKVDMWMKELGTPRELISRWRGGRVTWKEFESQYKRSLRGKEELIQSLRMKSAKGTVTLLCTERDSLVCHRSILKAVIESQAGRVR